METVKIYKDGIYKNIPKPRLAEYTSQGFCPVDKSGKPVAKSADAKALGKELDKATAALDEANSRIKDLEARLEAATAALDEAKREGKEGG